jgi:SPP1 family phage portal protein
LFWCLFYCKKGGEIVDELQMMQMLNDIRAFTGRKKIFTEEPYVDASNVLDVVASAYGKFTQIQLEIQFLIDYDRGVQPSMREKKVRPEIDYHVQDNLAHFIKKWKGDYFWGQPPMLVQRSDDETPESDASRDGKAIAKLNSYMVNNVHVGYEDQKLADFVEICGIGHRFVDIRSRADRTGLPFKVHTLDSRYTFVIYYDGIGEPPVCAVTFAHRGDGYVFTAYTDDMRFDIKNGEIISAQINPLGMIPIVEYEGAIDRMGCFERLLPELQGLNLLVSDLHNDVDQHVQEIWWTNDVSFTDPRTGERVTPESGDWVQTFTGGEGNHPNIKPLSGTLDSTSTLNMVNNERNHILELANVPIRYSSEGGGSTGVAMDVSSGWSAAEVDAQCKEQLIEKAKREELELVIRAIQLAPQSVIGENDILKNVRAIDCNFHFNRRKNYDMAVKANTFATYVSHGLHGRHALKEIDAFSDVEQVWEDSKDLIEAFQKNAFLNGANQTEEHIMQDESDQSSQSPIVDGMNTNRTGAVSQ